MTSYAPLFANINDVNASPNAIYFNSSHSFGTPSHYNNQIFVESFRGVKKYSLYTVYFNLSTAPTISVSITTGHLISEFSTSKNNASDVYVIKMINYGNVTSDLEIDLQGLSPAVSLPVLSDLTVLHSRTDDPNAQNSLDQPRLVYPSHSIRINNIGVGSNANVERGHFDIRDASARFYSGS